MIHEYYRISDIIEEADEKNRNQIANKISSQRNKNIINIVEPTSSIGQIVKSLSSEYEFNERFKQLSTKGREAFTSLYRHGLVLGIDGGGTTIPEGSMECLEKLIFFAVPSMDRPEKFIIPVEYAVFAVMNFSYGDPYGLVSMIKGYNATELQEIADYYGTNSTGAKTGLAIELFCAILTKMEDTIKMCTPEEKTILEYLMDNSGMVSVYKLMEDFKIKQTSVYRSTYISIHELFSEKFFSGGRNLVSLVRKGIITGLMEKYYEYIHSIIIPNEVYIYMVNERDHLFNKRRNKVGKRPLKPDDLKLYPENFGTNLKKLFVVVQYLEIRGKRRSIEALQKYMTCNTNEISIVVEYAMRESWLTGKTTSFRSDSSVYSFFKNPNFYKTLTQNIFERYILPSRHTQDTYEARLHETVRDFFVESMLSLETPMTLSEVRNKMSSNRNFIYAFRNVKALLALEKFRALLERERTGAVGDLMEETMKWIPLLVAYFSMAYGLVRSSSSHMDEDTYIMPLPLLRDIVESRDYKGKIAVADTYVTDLKVLPNHEIMVGIDAPFDHIVNVSSFADLLTADAICTFRISKSSLTLYISSQKSVKDIIEFLQKESSTGLPQNVEQLLKDMSGKEKDLSILKCKAILKVEDSSELSRIISLPDLKNMFSAQVSDNILIIRDDILLSDLVKRLRRNGFIIPFLIEEEKKLEKGYSRRW